MRAPARFVVLTRCAVIGMAVAMFSAEGGPPRFEDYAVPTIFEGKPAAPRLTSPDARMFRTRIREGVDKGWGVYVGKAPQGRPGPNFAGRYVVIRWGCGSPCIAIAVVDAQTGQVFSPPITTDGVGKNGFQLPLLTLGSRVGRAAELEFRLDSRLMIIRATPVQSARHPSYEYYFLREKDRWSLLRRVPLKDSTPLEGDP